MSKTMENPVHKMYTSLAQLLDFSIKYTASLNNKAKLTTFTHHIVAACSQLFLSYGQAFAALFSLLSTKFYTLSTMPITTKYIKE